jgi:hypothetical protein
MTPACRGGSTGRVCAPQRVPTEHFLCVWEQPMDSLDKPSLKRNRDCCSKQGGPVFSGTGRPVFDVA